MDSWTKVDLRRVDEAEQVLDALDGELEDAGEKELRDRLELARMAWEDAGQPASHRELVDAVREAREVLR